MTSTEIVSDHGVTIVTLEPDEECIRGSARQRFEELLELAATVDPPRLVIDMKHIHYVNSSFVAFLLRLSNQISVKRDGRFGICHLTPFCEQVVKGCRLQELFDLFETREEAMRTYSNQ